MCAILGITLADTQAFCRQQLYDALIALQHRGQDAAGIVTACSHNEQTRLNQVKGVGMVRNVFSHSDMLSLEGNAGIGHCRYPTAGHSGRDSAQPMYNNYPCGIALTHNGNLTNKHFLADHVRKLHRHLSTQSDSEVLLNVFAEELRMQLDNHPADGKRSDKINPTQIFAAVENTMKLCRGGYACILLIHDVGVVAFRDPWGIRPIVVGKRDSQSLMGGVDYVFASESVGCDILGYDLLRDVRPGECILAVPMTPDDPRIDCGLLERQLIGNGKTVVACLFEYVYFSRPDSLMNGVSVYESRIRMGKKLAEKIMLDHSNEQIDVVVPIPDTSRTSALACANVLQLPYREGFVKNRYIGRTFIMPEQSKRQRSVRLKLNAIKAEFKGRNVLLVDDSVVRGTTSNELVKMAREAGAKKVFLCSAAPEIRFPNVYGIDLPAKTELVAYGRTLEEISATIGCDWILYNNLSDLEDSVRELNPELKEFETSTFTGKYITEDIDNQYLDMIESERSNLNKVKDGLKQNGCQPFSALVS